MVALLGREAGVVARGGNSLLAEHVADVLDGAAAHAVDDAGALLMRANELEERLVLCALAAWPLHGKREVGAVEARHDAKRVSQAKRGLDVLANLARGRGGECHDGRARGQCVDEVTDALVAGAEVVSPLRDAVRLVHGEQAEAVALHHVEKGRVCQAFWGHVDQIQQAA